MKGLGTIEEQGTTIKKTLQEHNEVPDKHDKLV